jgi:uncharacterized protein YecE (DUF72 family)
MMRKVQVGTMGWSYGFWKEGFYPKDLASKDLLAYYATRFSTVEVDSTFYRIPRRQSVVDWREQTPSGFLLSLKFPRMITHVKMLKDCSDETSIFLDRAELLQEKLGPLLLQFPPSFGDEHVPLLREFLENLPKQHRYVVEVRNRKLLNDGFYSVLRDNAAVLAWVDSPFVPLVNEVTSDFIYVRWEGDRRRVDGTLGKTEVNRAADIRLWADRIRPFLNSQKEIFGYFSKYYSGYPPLDVSILLEALEIGE